ncbi:MAG TPA: OB-fold nucleic acid binding domain-containing protein, partial [Stellaceae bacterium]|nr:OB-fold nucleic acid binding domain-containing protein [Stellaceae bacterium]
MAEKQNPETKSATDYRAQRLDKLAQLKQLGVDPYASGFTPDARAADLDAKYKELAAGAETHDRVKVAGRIRALRNSGMFIDLHDATGKIQIFCHKDNLAPAALAILKLLDLGDLIGVEGMVRRTPRGELTINAGNLTVLA